MVSTRQMTIGNNGIVEGNQSPSEGPARFTRNSSIATTSGIVQSCKTPHVQSVFLLNLPQEVIEKILSYLPFKNICHLRLVSRTMDHICSQMLNSTFLKLQNQMLARFQEIKAKMPRRESARRSHHLACESDIIETLHMRLTLLQMSFGKHIERKHICFFPGEILDEVHHILYYIKVTPKLDLPYKVTDELFDLSTMAMEYFKEKIEPFLPDIAYFSTDFLNFSGSFANSSTLTSDVSKDSGHASTDEIESGEDAVEHIPQSNMVLRKRIRKIKQGMKRYNSQLSLLRQDLRSCKKKTSDQQKQISEQQKLLADQQKQTLEYATRLDEYDKKNEEISRKFSTLLQELNKCKTELQYWRCRSPASPPFCQTCGIAIPPQSDELQALINQGVHPEGLGAELLVEPSSPPAVAGSLSPGRPAEVVAAVSAADPKHSERTTEAEKSTNEPGPSSSEPVAAAVNKGKRKAEGGAAPAPVASPLKDDPPKKKKKKTGRFVQIRAKRIARL